MCDDRTTLSRFCEARAPHRFDAAFLFRELEEYFVRGVARRYRLDDRPPAGEGCVMEAVRRVRGAPVLGVRTYGRGDLHPLRPSEGRRTCDVFAREGMTAIERDTCSLLKTSVFERFVIPLERAMGPEEYHVLSETFMRTLGEPIWHSFENEYWEEVGYDLMLGVRALVLMSVHAFIGHVVWGDGDLACALHPFVRILTSCIPYGTSADGSEALIIVD